MEAIQAILSRHSVRDFKSDPVPKETIMKIMEAAKYSPSAGDGQPWEVFIAAGATIERIRGAYKSGVPGGPPAGAVQPPFIQERFATIRNERLKLLGLDPANPASGKVFLEWGARLYNAPVLVVICMDKALTSNLDIGLFAQTICLAAQDYGVDSLIAGFLTSKPELLRKELGIPESLNIIIGIGLGYANPKAIINTYRSPRRPIQEMVRYRE